MQLKKMEKELLYLALSMFALLALSVLLTPFRQFIQGITQTLLGGNSVSTVLFLLLGIALLSLICFAGIRLGLQKKLERHEKNLLAFFLIALFAGYLLGFYLQIDLMQSFNARGPFAAMTVEGNYINWEATSVYHNHLPKASIFVLKQLMPFLFTGMEDDGRPLYEVMPNAFGIGLAFLLIELIVLFAGISFILSKIKKIKLMDAATFFFALLSLMIVMVNGGIPSNYFIPGFFLLCVFLSMNYFKGLQAVKVFLPLLVALALTAFLGRLVDEAFLETTGFYFMVLFTGIWFYAGFKKTRKELPKLFSFLLLLLMVYYVFSASMFLSNEVSKNAFGKQVMKQNITSIYVYGLPEKADEAEIKQALNGLAEVIDLKKIGWAALMQVKAEKDFRLKEFEAALKELKPKTYLIAEQITDFDRFNFYQVHFLDGLPENTESLIGREIMDINITWFKEIREKNYVEIATKAKTPDLLQMLSILTKIKENYAGRVLVVRI